MAMFQVLTQAITKPLNFLTNSLLLCAATLSLLPLNALAQESNVAIPTASHERPRVALVLSGGGARGFAHIGVLRVLKEMRIPVDYVVGTSMGAVVGGAYAAGRSVEDIEQIVQHHFLG